MEEIFGALAGGGRSQFVLARGARFVQRQSRAKRRLRLTARFRQPPSAGDHLCHLTGNAHVLAKASQE